MAITVACPSCEAKLKVGDQYAGRKIKCPKCQNPIAVPHAKGENGPQPRKSQARSDEEIPGRKKSRVPDDEEEDTDEEEPKQKDRPKKKKKKKAKSGKGLWIGLGAGGVVLIAGIVVAIVLMNNSGNTKNPPGPVAKGGNPSEGTPNGENPNGENPNGENPNGNNNNNNNPVPGPSVGNAALTSDNLKKIKTGMKKEDIVAIFGPARNQITGAEIAQKVLGNPTFGDAYQDEVNAYNNGELLAYIQDGAVLLVGIMKENDPDPKLRGKIGRAWLYYRQGGNLVAEVLELKNGRLDYNKKSTPYGG